MEIDKVGRSSRHETGALLSDLDSNNNNNIAKLDGFFSYIAPRSDHDFNKTSWIAYLGLLCCGRRVDRQLWGERRGEEREREREKVCVCVCVHEAASPFSLG